MSSKAILGFFLIFTFLTIQSCHSKTASQPETQTGIDVVDNVVTAILNKDLAQQRDLLVFNTVACTIGDGLGGPPKCEDDEENGMTVEVFPILGPEGHFIRKKNLKDWPGIQAEELYAVYRVAKTVFHDDIYPVGEYAIIFTTEVDQNHIIIRIREGGIVRIDYAYMSSPDEILQREAVEVLFMP